MLMHGRTGWTDALKRLLSRKQQGENATGSLRFPSRFWSLPSKELLPALLPFPLPPPRVKRKRTIIEEEEAATGETEVKVV